MPLLLILMQATHTEATPFEFCVMPGTEEKAVKAVFVPGGNTTASQSAETQ